MAVRLQFAQMYFCQMCLKILRTDVICPILRSWNEMKQFEI